MKSGFVSLIGRPNVGKSTLLNTLINQKIAITSNKPQTTRNIIQGIYNEDGYQIVFVDTPGIHKPLNKLGKVLNKEAQSLTKDVDLVLFVVDGQIVSYNIGTLFSQENPYIPLDDSQVQGLSEIYRYGINDVLSSIE